MGVLEGSWKRLLFYRVFVGNWEVVIIFYILYGKFKVNGVGCIFRFLGSYEKGRVEVNNFE